MASIKLKDIRKTYEDGVTVIDKMNLEINDKEFIILVGPSGCGKSTTLRMIAGLEEISGGELYIGDKVVNKVSPKDRDIAMVFQSYALYPHMNVYKNMAFGLKNRKVPKDEIDKKVKVLDDKVSELHATAMMEIDLLRPATDAKTEDPKQKSDLEIFSWIVPSEEFLKLEGNMFLN